jgi:CBS domain-containing protein
MLRVEPGHGEKEALMPTVGDILKVKGPDVCCVEPRATVYEALAVMADRNIGALLVLEGGRVVGIFSERDYARQVILKGRASKDTPVRDVMTARVMFVSAERSLDECMALMTDRHIRHLPVLAEGELAGIVSIGDVVKAVISEKEFLISQLENYINSGG